MRNKRIRPGMIGILVSALVTGLVLWTGSVPFARALFAQAPQQAGDDDCGSCDSHGKTPAAKQVQTDEQDDQDDKEKGDCDSHGKTPTAKQDHADEQDDQDDHEGEDGDEHTEPGHDDEEGREGEPSIRLSPKQMSRFGVMLAVAGPGTLHRQIRLPGEIVVNADRETCVVPPASGVARQVNVSVGDRVSTGQTMAVLESAELSEAKTQYLTRLNELTCCSAELTRAQALDTSARELLKALEKSPTLDQLQAVKLAAMAEGHSKLIAAYAEFVFARAEYEREKKLVEQDISSRADFQTATSAYKKAFAGFVAGRDALAYQTQRSLLEAQQSRKNMELELRATVQRLRVLGVSSKEVQALKEWLQGGGAVSTEEDCDEPDCAECEAHKATTRPAATKVTSPTVLGEQLGIYPLRAPFAGTVIDKHITLGEMLSNDAPVFTIADLSTVWVDLSVYQKDLPYVRKGQTVHIALGKETPPAEGKIAFVSPIVDSRTRTAKARIILANPRGVYRPGVFVTADIDVSSTSVPVLVPKAAVQQIEDRNVVFVPTEEGLVAQPVRLGRSSRTHVEIVEGLRAGEKYVAKGAFQLKAQIVTSGLGAHAGHGH